MPLALMQQTASVAPDAGAWIPVAEIYCGTEQGTLAPSFADLYERGIGTAGMSKACSLAGLRVGWVAAPREVIDAVNIHRDFSTISVCTIGGHFAALELDQADRIPDRSRGIFRTNLAIPDSRVAAMPGVSRVRPKARMTAILADGLLLPSRAFCTTLLDGTGVMIVPGDVFGIKGHIRAGYACATGVLQKALARAAEFLARHADRGQADRSRAEPLPG